MSASKGHVYIVSVDYHNDFRGVFSTLEKAIDYIDIVADECNPKNDYEIWRVPIDDIKCIYHLDNINPYKDY